MRKLLSLAVVYAAIGVYSMSAAAAASNADAKDTELMSAAVDVGHRYDAYYAAKDSVGMASLYTPDGVFLTVAGQPIKGNAALQAYYSKSFAGGGQGHTISVNEVHQEGAGGFALASFSINVPKKDGGFNKVEGHLVALLAHDVSGWHLALVAPSIPPSVSK